MRCVIGIAVYMFSLFCAYAVLKAGSDEDDRLGMD